MAQVKLSGTCCGLYDFSKIECPIHGSDDGEFYLFNQPNEQSCGITQKAMLRSPHSSVESARILGDIYSPCPSVGVA